MDVENLKSWVSQPDVCRCCLSASGTWDLTASYVTEAGIKEVFSDILQECYGISLSYLSEWGPSRLVCALCVGHLRDATSFKKQVQEADKYFTEYLSKKDSIETVKTEPDMDYCADDFADQMEIGKTDTSPLRKGVKLTLKQNKSANRKRHKHSRAQEKPRNDSDCDSDTPLTLLSKSRDIDTNNSDINNDDNMGHIALGCEETDDKTDNHIAGHQPVKINAIKQISERRRVILTCGAVLRDTTACPFRHHKSWFQCFFCHENFIQLNLLRTHTNETHSDIEGELKKIKRYPRSLQIEISNLECRHCNLNLTDVENMRRHLCDVHNKVIYRECIADYKVDASPYTCHLCTQEFHVFRTLTTHLNEHYANCICDVCGKSFLNSKRLKVHKRTHDIGNFPCSECGKTLKTKISKANHMESAHSKRIIKCQICFKPMKHYNDRIKHMSEAHNITHKFKCPICAREYNIKHYLATHIRQTHGHKNKKCSECGMAFITNHGLKKHMLKHTGEKPYTCSVCCKAYARSYTLREHMRAHENDRRYMCPE
ncbi:zinc finger protein 708-like isoform X2 [Cydia pomonella]|uniref:zinc finger protein 708-like isoform X2 n=1 Tax=Cydia pomonella TaxID=82600 RepID=UPI002ADDF4E4|nr:zinc finger protein 708-like isoform X2 [Cydia pomonella]